MVGGFTVDAVGEVLNLAGYIEDGQRIYVPFAGDLESGGGPAGGEQCIRPGEY